MAIAKALECKKNSLVIEMAGIACEIESVNEQFIDQCCIVYSRFISTNQPCCHIDVDVVPIIAIESPNHINIRSDNCCHYVEASSIKAQIDRDLKSAHVWIPFDREHFAIHKSTLLFDASPAGRSDDACLWSHQGWI